MRTSDGKEMEKARISISYYEKMEDRRIERLGYRAKSKIARRRRD
jgi:hypothetical protein